MDELSNEWIQFDCTECLVIEYSYQAYTISKRSEFHQVETLNGKIDFDTFEMVPLVKTTVIK